MIVFFFLISHFHIDFSWIFQKLDWIWGRQVPSSKLRGGVYSLCDCIQLRSGEFGVRVGGEEKRGQWSIEVVTSQMICLRETIPPFTRHPKPFSERFCNDLETVQCPCERRKCSRNRSNWERLKMCSWNGSELGPVPGSLPSLACENNSVLEQWTGSSTVNSFESRNARKWLFHNVNDVNKLRKCNWVGHVYCVCLAFLEQFTKFRVNALFRGMVSEPFLERFRVSIERGLCVIDLETLWQRLSHLLQLSRLEMIINKKWGRNVPPRNH